MSTCVTCELPEDRWDPTDPLYICGGIQCPDCTRFDLDTDKHLDHAEATR